MNIQASAPIAAFTRLSIKISYIEGALIRILGLVGRRQFEIENVNARRSSCGSMYEIQLDLRSTRCAENLRRQIEKLYDVREVSTLPAATLHPSTQYAPARVG